jgi:16S rRNA (cytosine1402-N4)-methyltransferase
MDQDMDAWENRLNDSRFTFAHGNFVYLKNFMRYYGIDGVDGILADLGVSFHHFDAVERGFTFRADAPLDMRMNRSASFTAQELLNTYSEERLADVLHLYGELRQSRRMAAAIVKARPLSTTGQLVEAVESLLKPAQMKKELSMLFQALRIEVNGELDALRRLLTQSRDLLNPGGRLAIITYHSLEDRLVKNFMRTGNVEGKLEKDFFGRVNTPWRVVTSKVIIPSAEEVERNPRSRSAKLRVAELVARPERDKTDSN